MSKDAYYFSHDSNARNDEKILSLRMKLGMEGYGIYWAIIEMLRDSKNNVMQTHYERIAFELHTDCEKVKSVINDFELFSNDDNAFWSDSLCRRMELKAEKSKKASESAKARWNKADAMQTHSEGNASKVKESKGNKIKGKENNIDSRELKILSAFKNNVKTEAKELSLSESVINEFLEHWTGRDFENKCFAWQVPETFIIRSRLKGWNKRKQQDTHEINYTDVKMRQAYAHIEENTTNYGELKGLVVEMVKDWNDTHTTKTDPQKIWDMCKRIFKYHKWISIDEVKPTFDLGLMGEFGENKGLNSETIYRWFTGFSKAKNQSELKDHSAYKTETTFIPMEQRKQTRNELVDIFMNFFNEYKKTKVYNPAMNHYVPVFFRWFKMLKYLEIDDETKRKLARQEADQRRNMRTLFARKPDSKETDTLKSIFMESFIVAANNDFPIEDQLKKLKL